MSVTRVRFAVHGRLCTADNSLKQSEAKSGGLVCNSGGSSLLSRTQQVAASSVAANALNPALKVTSQPLDHPASTRVVLKVTNGSKEAGGTIGYRLWCE